jgi:hypothetical protein
VKPIASAIAAAPARIFRDMEFLPENPGEFHPAGQTCLLADAAMLPVTS